MNTEKRKQIAAKLLGEIDWQDETTGFLKCPGEDLHTTKSTKKDCRVSIDGAPTIYCLHQSCTAVVAEKNKILRREIGSSESGSSYNAPQKNFDRLIQTRRLAARAEALKEMLLSPSSPFAWPVSEIINGSTLKCRPPSDQAYLLFSLFDPDAIVWNGEVWESGQPQHGLRFRPVREWKAEASSLMRLLDLPIPFGPFIVPSRFKAGSTARTKENLIEPCFLVVESDVLMPDEFGAILRWLNQELDMHLYAVISTGGKSLHGWFKYPPPELLAELKVILPILGCDPKMFGPTQPCRMAGVLRRETGRIQEMIYFSRGDL